MTAPSVENIILIIAIATIAFSAIAAALVYMAGYLTNTTQKKALKAGPGPGGGSDDITIAIDICNSLNQIFPNDETSFNAAKSKSGNCYVRNCCQWGSGGTGGLLVTTECLNKC